MKVKIVTEADGEINERSEKWIGVMADLLHEIYDKSEDGAEQQGALVFIMMNLAGLILEEDIVRPHTLIRDMTELAETMIKDNRIALTPEDLADIRESLLKLGPVNAGDLH